jgi:hypothetical protein
MKRTLIAVLALTACSSEPELDPLVFAEGCQPLFAGEECFMPYPSDFYLVADGSQPSGQRVEITGAANVYSDQLQNVDSGTYQAQDGFSRNPTIIFSLLAETDGEGLIRLDGDYEASRQPSTSATVLIEAGTGRRIAHFVDIDPLASQEDRRSLMIRPLEELLPQTRYIVGVHGLSGPSGLLPVPEGFRRLRDQQSAQDPSLNERQSRFDDEVFAPLVSAGFDRSSLQLAWDFTTASDESVTADMLRIRDLTMQWLQTQSPSIEVTEVREFRNDDRGVWRYVYGKITGPRFLASSELGAMLNKPAGQVEQNGEFEFSFIAMVPSALKTHYGPGRVIGYGHGFFGSYREVQAGSVTDIANHLKAVVVGIPWSGMTEVDAAILVGDMVDEPAKMIRFGERVHQAQANWIVTSHAVKNQLFGLPEMQRPQAEDGVGVLTNDEGQTNAGQPFYDPSWMGFLGISQGHILGGTLAALNPDIDRLALNVGGCAFTHMMSRSANFSYYLMLIETLTLTDPFERQKMLAMMQPIFDRFDPAIYAKYVLREPLPGSPPDRRILMQTGFADPQVPDFTAQLHARLLGIPLLEPSPEAIWGLETVQSPAPASAYTYHKYDVDASFRQTAKPTDVSNQVHEGIRRLEVTKEQLDVFLRPGGVIEHRCDGPCDPD